MKRFKENNNSVIKGMSFYNLYIVFFTHILSNYIYLYHYIYHIYSIYICNNIVYFITKIIRNIHSIFFKATLIFRIYYTRMACNFCTFCISAYSSFISGVFHLFYGFLRKEICHD